jgi:hypothetical protein
VSVSLSGFFHSAQRAFFRAADAVVRRLGGDSCAVQPTSFCPSSTAGEVRWPCPPLVGPDTCLDESTFGTGWPCRGGFGSSG